VVALTRLREQLEAERTATSSGFPEVPFVTLNLARIDGGVAINVVPEGCILELGLRPLPGVSSEDLVARVRETVTRELGEGAFTLDLLGDSPPMILDEGSDLYRHLCRELNQSATYSVSFATDAGWFQNAGVGCVVFGPGSIEVAHRPNEFIPKAEMERADGVLSRMIGRFCG